MSTGQYRGSNLGSASTTAQVTSILASRRTPLAVGGAAGLGAVVALDWTTQLPVASAVHNIPAVGPTLSAVAEGVGHVVANPLGLGAAGIVVGTVVGTTAGRQLRDAFSGVARRHGLRSPHELS